MNWHVPLLNELARHPCCGYQANDLAATEPTALAALALVGWGRSDAASSSADWLAELQAEDGSLGVRLNEPTPRWPTGLAVVAWLTVDDGRNRYAAQIDRALAWMLKARSKPLPRVGAMQHDTSLVAWPWVSGTHAWVEPTALNVLGLKAAGNGQHQRAREAVRLLLDRQLPAGGCNYGNTRVLGRRLRPHLLPTGLAMLALNGEDRDDPRIMKSLSFLGNHLSAKTPVLSLCWALLGLAAHGRRPAEANHWLAQISQRLRPSKFSGMHTALMLLAALAEDAPLARIGTPTPQVAASTRPQQ